MPKEEDDSDDDQEEEVELEVVLDDEGRITGTSNIGFNFDFYSCENSHLISSDSSENDILSTLKIDVDSIFDGCTTFWLPATNFEPRTTFERLAKQIFDFHTKDLKSDVEIDWNQSGAEYWTQKRDLTDHIKKDKTTSAHSSSRAVLANDDTMIRFHFDKDEELVDQTEGGITVHPQLSTITYLTDGGNPTLIFPYLQPPPSTSAVGVNVDADGDGDICDDNNDNDADDRDTPSPEIKRIFASYPKLGKHVSFDGRYLHGCPSTLSIADPPDGIRMTFLVNIWLNWKPLGPEVYADEDLALLSNVPVELANLIEKPPRTTLTENTDEDDTGEDKIPPRRETLYTHMNMSDRTAGTDIDVETDQFCTAYFGPQGWDQTLKFPWPSHQRVQAAQVETQCSSICVECSPERSCQVYPTIQPFVTAVPYLEYHADVTPQDIYDKFQEAKVLLIKNVSSPPNMPNVSCAMASCLRSVADLYHRFPDEVTTCWNDLGNENQQHEDTLFYSPNELFGLLEAQEETVSSSPSRKKQRTTADGRSSLNEVTQPWQVNLRVREASHPGVFRQTVKSFCEHTFCSFLFNGHNNNNNNSNNSNITEAITPKDEISLFFGRLNNSPKCIIVAPAGVESCDNRETKDEEEEEEEEEGEEEEEEEEEEEGGEEGEDNTAAGCQYGPSEGTCYLPLSGALPPWYIQPDETQDWRNGPPPVTALSKPLRVDVSMGDVLLINKQFWLHQQHHDGEDEQKAGGDLFFVVSRDFTGSGS